MGDVYLAEDTRLDRKVALKILPPEFADNTDRKARFTREAKAVAALNHPNVVTVHSVEEAGDVHFITMELVKGKALAEILPKGALPLASSSRSRFPWRMRLGQRTSKGSRTEI
jgi:eukaryotic-like serine/threonine-protein kinase